VRDIVTQDLRELLAVIGEDLRVPLTARDGDIGHAVVQQIHCDSSHCSGGTYSADSEERFDDHFPEGAVAVEILLQEARQLE